MGLHIRKICSKSTLMSYLGHLEMVNSLFIESLPLALCLCWMLKRYDLICPSSYFQLRLKKNNNNSLIDEIEQREVT